MVVFRRSWVLLTVFAACGGGVTGRWDGDCEIQSGGQIVLYDVELDLEERGHEISGDGELTYGYIYQGDVEGERDGKDVVITWEVESQGYLYEVELAGELDKDRMSGDCEIRGKGVNYLATGEFDVGR